MEGSLAELSEHDRAEEMPPPGYAELAEALCEGVAFAEGGRILWASPHAARLLGVREPAEARGRDMHSFLRDAGDGMPTLDSEPVACGVRGLDDEVRLRVHWRRFSGGPAAELLVLRDESGEARAGEEVLRLGCALHAANRELDELRDVVAAAATDRTDLVTVLAHELRTPLTVITGYNRLLVAGEAGPLTSEQRRFLKECGKSCAKLVDFVAGLLDSAQDGFLENGLEIEQGDLEPLLADVRGLLAPMLADKNVRVDVRIGEGAGRAWFDTTRIEQVVANLVGNAIRYTKSDGVLRIETARIRADGDDLVEVSVVDQGPGVASVDRDRIFEPYVRGGDDGEGRGSGLGLGLAICRRIVDAHGGTISVHDEPGGGSRFAFTLPVDAGRAGAR